MDTRLGNGWGSWLASGGSSRCRLTNGGRRKPRNGKLVVYSCAVTRKTLGEIGSYKFFSEWNTSNIKRGGQSFKAPLQLGVAKADPGGWYFKVPSE